MARRGSVRLLSAVVIGVSLLLATAGPSLAKFPYFSVVLDPIEPRPDEPVTVTVRTWADAAHSQPAGFAHEGSLVADLLAFRRVDDGAGPAVVNVPLAMVSVDLYRGDVTLPAGEWRLVAFPHGKGADTSIGGGYPEPIQLVMADESAVAPWAVLGVLGAAAAVVTGASTVRLRRPNASRIRDQSRLTDELPSERLSNRRRPLAGSDDREADRNDDADGGRRVPGPRGPR